MRTDVLVIGGGPAGMSAALSASENGSHVVLVERDHVLGGILNQCIHNGFGLHYFKEELTGPEFAHRFREMVEKDKNIKVLTNTLVTTFGEKKVSVIGEKGAFDISFKACVHSRHGLQGANGWKHQPQRHKANGCDNSRHGAENG